MPLDLSSFRQAITALEKSVRYLDSELARDPGVREQFRAAAIQGFEFTFELAFKMLRRRLESQAAAPALLREASFMSLIRSGADAGLVRDVGRFRVYRDIRNITSHTYNAQRAEEVMAVLPQFLDDARFLRDRLAAHNDA